MDGKQIDEHRTIHVNPENIKIEVGEKVPFRIKVFGTVTHGLFLDLSIVNSVIDQNKFTERLTLNDSEFSYTYVFNEAGTFHFIADVRSSGMEEKVFVASSTIEVSN